MDVRNDIKAGLYPVDIAKDHDQTVVSKVNEDGSFEELLRFKQLAEAQKLLDGLAEQDAAHQDKPVQLRVISQGDKVLLNFSAPVELTGFTPERALVLANDLRQRANLILHERHQAEARKRRERK
jgi:hypothetical protein